MKTIYAKDGRVRAVAFSTDPKNLDYGAEYPVADSFNVQVGDPWPPAGFKVVSGLLANATAFTPAVPA